MLNHFAQIARKKKKTSLCPKKSPPILRFFHLDFQSKRKGVQCTLYINILPETGYLKPWKKEICSSENTEFLCSPHANVAFIYLFLRNIPTIVCRRDYLSKVSNCQTLSFQN